MDFYFVSRYSPKNQITIFFGLFELQVHANVHCLAWKFGEKNFRDFMLKLNMEEINNVYLIDEVLLGKTYNYGFPLKPHYFNNCISKSEIENWTFTV